MTLEFQRIQTAELLALADGHPAQVDRLRRAARLVGAAPFEYPAQGPILVFLASDGERVRISEGGRALKFLESQGMDLGLDAVLGKTVFHALKDVEGAAAGNGRIYLDTTPEAMRGAIWRFLQMVIEIVGLRHAKYKDALEQLARTEGSGMNWDER